MFIFSTVLSLTTATAVVSTVVSGMGGKNNELLKKKRSLKLKEGQKIENVKQKNKWYLVCQLWVDNVASNSKYDGIYTQKDFLASKYFGKAFMGTPS